MRKTLCAFITVALVLLSFYQPLIRSPQTLAGPSVSIINPGPDGYPLKWNASTIDRGFGTSDFIFYSNETAVDSTFFMNVTVRDIERMKGWAIGIIYSNTSLSYASAWRPSDHVFKPVEQMGWTLIAPSVTFEDVNATHKLLAWGCTYIMGTPEWTFNGTGQLCQIQFKITKEVNETYRMVEAWFAFDPIWTALYQHPTGTIIPQMGTGYFKYAYPELGEKLEITTAPGGTTDPPPGTHYFAPGTVVTVTAISFTGYVFDHWVLDGVENRTENPISITMDTNHTLHAVFERLPWYVLNISIIPDGSGTTTRDPESPWGNYTYVDGTQVNVTAKANEAAGYVFDCWEVDGTNRTENPITVIMDRNHTLIAYFFQPPRTLTINATTGGTTDHPAPGSYTYPYGTEVLFIEAISNAGYTFKHWEKYVDTTYERVYDNPCNVTMMYNITLTAVFADNTAPQMVNLTQNPPAENVQPNQPVKVSVNVTDLGSGVKNVTLLYRTDTTWYSIPMTENATTGLWEVTIPGYNSSLGSILVNYTVVAYDYAGNNATTGYSSYQVPDLSPPSITILWPENKTYTTSSVTLSIRVNEMVSWMGYSLDGQANVTITGNTTLTELTDGSHTIIAYANDTSGNTGASAMVYFTVSAQEAFPPWLIAAVVIIIGFIIAVLVYKLKVKRE